MAVIPLLFLFVPFALLLFIAALLLEPWKWFRSNAEQRCHDAWKKLDAVVKEATNDNNKTVHGKDDKSQECKFEWEHGLSLTSRTDRKDKETDRHWGAYEKRFQSPWNDENAKEIRLCSTGTVHVSWFDFTYVGINKIIKKWTECFGPSRYELGVAYNEATAYNLFGRVCFTIQFHDIPKGLDLMMFKRRFFKKTSPQTSNIKSIPNLASNGEMRTFTVFRNWFFENKEVRKTPIADLIKQKETLIKNNPTSIKIVYLEKKRLRERFKEILGNKSETERIKFNQDMDTARSKEEGEMFVLFHEKYEGDAEMKKKLNAKGPNEVDDINREMEKKKRQVEWAITYGDIIRRTHGHELFVYIHNDCVTFSTIQLSPAALEAKENCYLPFPSFDDLKDEQKKKEEMEKEMAKYPVLKLNKLPPGCSLDLLIETPYVNTRNVASNA